MYVFNCFSSFNSSQDPKQCTYKKAPTYDEARMMFENWINNPKETEAIVSNISDVMMVAVALCY